MQQPDQKEMFDRLEQQRQQQQQVDRVFKIVLPILAFLLSVICANMNWQSTLGTFVALFVAFYAVGIYRIALGYVLVAIIAYTLLDNYFSYQGFKPENLRFQLTTMLIFVGMVSVGRPYIDRWLSKKST